MLYTESFCISKLYQELTLMSIHQAIELFLVLNLDESTLNIVQVLSLHDPRKELKRIVI